MYVHSGRPRWLSTRETLTGSAWLYARRFSGLRYVDVFIATSKMKRTIEKWPPGFSISRAACFSLWLQTGNSLHVSLKTIASSSQSQLCWSYNKSFDATCLGGLQISSTTSLSLCMLEIGGNSAINSCCWLFHWQRAGDVTKLFLFSERKSQGFQEPDNQILGGNAAVATTGNLLTIHYWL